MRGAPAVAPHASRPRTFRRVKIPDLSRFRSRTVVSMRFPPTPKLTGTLRFAKQYPDGRGANTKCAAKAWSASKTDNCRKISEGCRREHRHDRSVKKMCIAGAIV